MNRAALHLAVWRWHFWAGLFVSPVLLVVTLAGALWTFQPQLDPVLDAPLFVVAPPADPSATRASLDTRLAAATAAYPDWTHVEFHEPARPDRAMEITARQGDAFRMITVNPHTGVVLGHRDVGDSFFEEILALHTTLFAGLTGRLLVETATSWGLVTLLTGLALWWPKAWRGAKRAGLWTLRPLRHRLGLRDLHAIPGVYALLLASLLMGTGLVFSPVWGTAWFAGLYATGRLPSAHVDPPPSPPPAPGAPRAPLDAALARARQLHPFSEYVVTLPHRADDSIALSTPLTKPSLDGASVWLHAYTGEPLVFLRFADLPLLTQATLYAYPLHTGAIFGWPTQVLAILVCLVIAVMTVTGVLLWWRRRPAGEFGAPAAKASLPTPRAALLVLALSAILLPTVGITLLLTLGVSSLGNFSRLKTPRPLP